MNNTNVVRRIVQVIMDRIVAVVGSLFAARLETLAVLEQAEQENELEERAKEFDEQGKPRLAAALRARAENIKPDVPGALGLRVICNLGNESNPAGPPLLEGSSDDNCISDDIPPRTRRRSSRRTSRRSSTKEQIDNDA